MNTLAILLCILAAQGFAGAILYITLLLPKGNKLKPEALAFVLPYVLYRLVKKSEKKIKKGGTLLPPQSGIDCN